MRVVSMVPSWTETLIQSGVNVVGRTRYCIHPKETVQSIAIVGGTKNWDYKKVLSLRPDLIILDKEENPKSMSEQSEIPIFATHVQSAHDLPDTLKNLSKELDNNQLLDCAQSWESVIQSLSKNVQSFQPKYPGLIEWGRKPQHPVKKIIYIIWKDPWMAVSQNTFIGSMLELCGYQGLIETYETKYPKINLNSQKDKESTLLLFSSEPYPFLKKKDDLDQLNFPYLFVDGESFSWFGMRSLEFLSRVNGLCSNVLLNN